LPNGPTPTNEEQPNENDEEGERGDEAGGDEAGLHGSF